MKKILTTNKKYQIAKWLLPTAIIMVFTTSLTISRAEASDVVISYDQEIGSHKINSTDLIALTNHERVINNLSPLTTNELLTKAAQAKALDLKTKGYFDHFRPGDGKKPWDFIEEAGYRWRVAGENLARGYQTSGQVVAAWMASDIHRKNILNQRYEEIGIATIEGTKDGQPVTVTVQMFGTPR